MSEPVTNTKDRTTAQATGIFPAPPAAERRPFDRVVEATPLLAVMLIAALLGFLVWFADRSEREEAGLALIRDALWVEQALRFQLEADQASVERLALDLGARPPEEVAVARLRALLSAHPEIVALEWRDASGALRTVVPPDALVVPEAGPQQPRPVHGFAAPRPEAGRGEVADLVVPIFDNDVRVGSLTAVSSSSGSSTSTFPGGSPRRTSSR